MPGTINYTEHMIPVVFWLGTTDILTDANFGLSVIDLWVKKIFPFQTLLHEEKNCL